MLDKVATVCRTDFRFDNFNEVSDFFKKIINILKQMNYSDFESDKFEKFNAELEELMGGQTV